ncbi:MAG: S26 family signal peptidase [Clostridia bacterium]
MQSRLMEHELVRVDGRSMQDALQNQEIMFVTKYDYLWNDPQQFDIVICHYPNRSNSNDSHVIGTLTRKQVVGHVQAVIFPFSGMRVIE